MSLIYFKKCDSCGNVSDVSLTPNPPGWHCLADNMHGTLATFDLCPVCLEAKGLRDVMNKRTRSRAIAVVRDQMGIVPELAEALKLPEIVAKIEAGDYDEVFERGEGINLLEEAQQIEALEAYNLRPELEDADEEIVDAEVISNGLG